MLCALYHRAFMWNKNKKIYRHSNERTGMKYLLFILLLVVILITAGCVGGNKNTVFTPTPTPENILSTIDPSEMALQLSDLPDDFTIKDRSEGISSDINQSELNFSWKRGYIVKFSSHNTQINQFISIFSIDYLPKLFAETKGRLQNAAGSDAILDELSDPKIGDQSKAFRVTYDDGSIVYSISFIKNDVYEDFLLAGLLSGTQTAGSFKPGR